MPWDLFLLTFAVGLLYGSVLAILAVYLLVIARRSKVEAAPAPPLYDAHNVTRLPRVDHYC